MDDRDVVGIDARPALEMVQQAVRRRVRRQQRDVDVVVVQQSQKSIDILQTDGAIVAHEECLAVELGAPVNERRQPGGDQIAAEIVAV